MAKPFKDTAASLRESAAAVASLKDSRPDTQPHERVGKPAHTEMHPMTNWVYDVFLWTFSILVDLFFREVHPRGSWKIPRRGPIIFVAAPHANQFVDPLVLMRTLRIEAHRRVAFLIAEKSIRRKFIGWFSRHVGAVPVGRAMDMVKPATGTIYLPNIDDVLHIKGHGTDFTGKDLQTGGLLVLPSVEGVAANAEVAEILGPEEVRLKKPFRGKIAMQQLTGRDDVNEDGTFKNKDQKGPFKGFQGIRFKTAPKVDQSKVYDAVFDRLSAGGAVGIFPEGGSHDRTELLPLKAGVAIMALGALAAAPDSGLKIIPCGMNYFHAHKFRSRAVIEFGNPIEIPPRLVEMYKSGERREAVSELLETVYQALVAVTVTSPDYDTLMLIQAARRLYNPSGKKLPLPMVVELNRRLVKGYTHYKDDPRIIELKKSVQDYNRQLKYLNLRDHQVEYARLSIPKVIGLFFGRLIKLAFLSIGVLPGTILFAPVFVAAKVISIQKSKEALAASTVKIQARDVVATWKLLVSMAFAPLLYTFYVILLVIWTYKSRCRGYMPESVPYWAIPIIGYTVFPVITFAALRFGEIGMDIAKSLRPLFLCLNPASGNSLVKLQNTRERLSHEVGELINTLGPEMFPDFDSTRILANPFDHGEGYHDPAATPPRTPGGSSARDTHYRFPSLHINILSSDHGHHDHAGAKDRADNLPRNDSFKDISNIGLFATRPSSRSRSRSSSAGGLHGSGGFPIKAFSKLDGKGDFEEVSRKIRETMRERGERRRRGKASQTGTESEGGEMTDGELSMSGNGIGNVKKDL
jgi:glycerol-3-phosphate O-acyltransferase/dihydroxyacetone phosphate acyltransferase